MSSDYDDAHKVALAFIKYRNGQLHLFKFSKNCGLSVSAAVEKYPWLPLVVEPDDIERVYSNWNAI